MALTDTWTQVEFYDAHDGGDFDGRRVELIGGMVRDMAPETRANSAVVNRLHGRFLLVCHSSGPDSGSDWEVQSRGGVATETSYVEPDICIFPAHLERNPKPADCAVIVEIVNSSVTRDEGSKRDLYRAEGAEL